MTNESPKIIMIIDDDNDIRLSLELLLKGKGYQLDFASNGEEALNRLASSQMPDLILLDMAMPVMDGWAFAKKLHELYPQHPKVVVMTAAADAKMRAEEVHADGFLSKPYSMRTLLDTIQTYI